MMLLFLVEEEIFTFFHDFKEVNIDLGLDVFTSISCLSIGQQYTIEGGASGNTTVRRVAYEFADGYCIVGDRVYKVLPNGDVDFDVQLFTRYNVYFGSGGETFTKSVYGKSFSLYEYLIDGFCEVTLLDHYDDERYYIPALAMDCWMDPVNQDFDCVDDPRMILESNWMCDSIKPYAFAIYSAETYGFLASVRGEHLRDNMPVEYVQGYADGKHRSTRNCVAHGWIDIGYVAVPSEWFWEVEENEIMYSVDEKYFTKVYFGSHVDCRNLDDLFFITNKLYELWDEGVFCLSMDEISKVFRGERGEKLKELREQIKINEDTDWTVEDANLEFEMLGYTIDQILK